MKECQKMINQKFSKMTAPDSLGYPFVNLNRTAYPEARGD